jgi:hypothetical protein
MNQKPTPPLASGLEWAHPLVRDWFIGCFGTPTEPQQEGWPQILAGKTTLISAPTGYLLVKTGGARYIAHVQRRFKNAIRFRHNASWLSI